MSKRIHILTSTEDHYYLDGVQSEVVFERDYLAARDWLRVRKMTPDRDRAWTIRSNTVVAFRADDAA